MRFRAKQTINLRRLEFEWQAGTGPFGMISVTDALKDAEANLEVRAIRCLPLGRVRGGAAAVKGEIMRYLADLAWAPDAILHNPSLTWSVINDQIMRVSAGRDHAIGTVELRMDENGLIGAVFAHDRPRKEGPGFVERPWHGRLFDYKQYHARWLPFSGEVGWIVNGQQFIAWRAEVLSWQIAKQR